MELKELKPETEQYQFKCRKFTFNLKLRTYLMGILNVTPDSFSDGGMYLGTKQAVTHALSMEQDGADIIDIGAQSTRPGATPISATKELKRIEKIVAILAKKLKIPISIDTSSAFVAKRCLDLGASIINDIFALRRDKRLGPLIAKFKAGVILMHMKGIPKIMQDNPQYKNLIFEIVSFLNQAKERALAYGISNENIIIDPGIGFGKTTEHNLEILKYLDRFKILKFPILIGTSRKSFIGNVLKAPVTDREFGTAASIVFAILKGAKFIRVHNVKAMKQVTLLTDTLTNFNPNN